MDYKAAYAHTLYTCVSLTVSFNLIHLHSTFHNAYCSKAALQRIMAHKPPSEKAKGLIHTYTSVNLKQNPNYEILRQHSTIFVSTLVQEKKRISPIKRLRRFVVGCNNE